MKNWYNSIGGMTVMNILIFYDSYYGNTQRVAEFIRDSLNEHSVSLVKVDLVSQDKIDASDFIIAGSPTRMFKMTKKIKKALKKMDYKGKLFWVFDTRADIKTLDNKFLLKMIKRFGYAAEKMQSILEKHKAKKAIDYTYYFVKDTEGPLFDDVKESVEKDIKRLKEVLN